MSFESISIRSSNTLSKSSSSTDQDTPVFIKENDYIYSTPSKRPRPYELRTPPPKRIAIENDVNDYYYDILSENRKFNIVYNNILNTIQNVNDVINNINDNISRNE
jgi:hypothetical protein